MKKLLGLISLLTLATSQLFAAMVPYDDIKQGTACGGNGDQ